MPSDKATTVSLAQRALACSKPRCRTLEQLTVITDLLTHLAVFERVDRNDLLAIAYFIESKHLEAGECVLSKGQPLEQWCLLLQGSALLTRYSAQHGSEQVTTNLGPNDSWSEAALLHSTHPRRSSVTVVAGPQGCLMLRLRYSDYDALNDIRIPLQLLPPEGAQGPLAVPELTPAQRRTAAMVLLCSCLRRLASARSLDVRTPEEASEVEPFLSALPAYKHYPPELVSSMAGACRSLSLPAGSLVYDHATLADAHVTVLSGEVQLRRLKGQNGEEDVEGNAAAGGSDAQVAPVPAGSGEVGGMRPAPPPGMKPGGVGQAQEVDGSSGRMNIRARLRREREARKIMQRQLDEYVSRMDSDQALQQQLDAAKNGAAPGTAVVAIKDPNSTSPVDWTRVFMQKAMRTVEPVWKALHPADKAPRRRQVTLDSNTLEGPFDGSQGPITEVAQLLGPAAAKAYYRGLKSQGYMDTESTTVLPSGRSGGARPSEAGSGGGGFGDSVSEDSNVRNRWRRCMFAVDGPESQHERTLRSMAMRASRINRESHARSRGPGGFDAEEMEEMYGPLLASLTRGSPVGELSIIMLHTAMRKESAVAGPGGCEVLMVDWEAYQQGVLAARAAVLGRSATFLGALPKERLSQIAELSLCVSVDAGTLLARQGAPLECMVVVQEGEVTLFHEPSAALHTRISTIRGHAVSRSRNGRGQPVPLLSSLNPSQMQGAPLGFGASGGGGVSVSGPTASGGSFTSSSTTPVEVTIQGLPLGELAAGNILGEAVLGARTSAGPARPASSMPSGHADPSQQSHGTTDPHQSLGTAVAATAVPVEVTKWAATVLAARASVLLVIPRSVLYMAEFDFVRNDLMKFATERRTWLARRVEAAYRSAAAPPTTPAVFVSGAAAAAAAATSGPQPPPHPPPRRTVVSGSLAVGGESSAVNFGSFPRRATSGDVSNASTPAAANAASESESGAAAVGGGSVHHHSVSRRRSVGNLQRSPSPSNTSAATTGPAASGPGVVCSSSGNGGNNGGSASRLCSKWDFLNAPTSAIAGGNGAGTDLYGTLLVPLVTSGGSFTRGGGGGPGTSLLDSANSIAFLSGATLTGSFASVSGFAAAAAVTAAAGPPPGSRRRLSNDTGRTQRDGGGGGSCGGLDVSSLTPVQQALLEAGLDPFFGGPVEVSYSGGGGGTDLERYTSGCMMAGGAGGGGGGTSSSVTTLPALTSASGPSALVQPLPPSPPMTPMRGLAPLNISSDFDALRAANGTTLFRSPNALTPTSRRSYSGSPGVLPAPAPLCGPVPFVDSVYGNSGSNLSPSQAFAALAGNPSSSAVAAAASASTMRGARTTHGVTANSNSRRRTEMDGGLSGMASSPTTGILASPSLTAHGPRVPALQALDPIDTALVPTVSTPPSPGLYSRSARSSFTGGVTPRMTNVDKAWLQLSVRGGGGGGSGFLSGVRPQGTTRDNSGGAGDIALAAAAALSDAEEETMLARSLVPKNQAGLFMVRGGAASTPARHSGSRRIANCF